MDLEQIILNIKNNYFNFLNNEDLSILVNNPKESDIRKIVNKIWNKYLSNPFDYQEDNFNFLVSKNGILFMGSLEFSEYPIFHDENHFLEILTPEKVLKESSSAGFIVSVDWNKTDKIYLPNDLYETKYIKAKLNPLAVFSINPGLGMVDSFHHTAEIISEEIKLLFITFNQFKLNKDYQFTKNDEDNIVRGLISYYLLDKDLVNIDKHQILRKKYGSYILKRFKDLVKEGIYNDDAFIKELSDYIDEKENIVKRSK